MKNFVNDLGKIAHSVVQAVSHLFSTHGREAESHHKGKGNCGKGIHDRTQGNTEIRCQRCVSSSRDLVQGTFTHKVREQVGRYQIGCGTCDQSGTVSQSHCDQKKLTGTL